MCARYVCKSAEHKINLWLPYGKDKIVRVHAVGCAGRRVAVTAPGLGQRFVGGVETALEALAAALAAGAPLRAPFGARAEQLGYVRDR